jgi:hypothetical protein
MSEAHAYGVGLVVTFGTIFGSMYLGTISEPLAILLLYPAGYFAGVVTYWASKRFVESDDSEERQADLSEFTGDDTANNRPTEPAPDEEPVPVAEPVTEEFSLDRQRAAAVLYTGGAAMWGVLVAFLFASTELWPTVVVGLGAVVAVIPLVFVDGRTYYAAAGSLYFLGCAGLFSIAPLPAVYQQDIYAITLAFVVLSTLIVGAQLGLGLLIKRLVAGVAGEDAAVKVYEALSAIAGLAVLIYTVLLWEEKAARYGGVAVGGSLGLLLDVLGIELPIPWIVADGVNATYVLYLGAVIIGFHTLESLHTTWRATKATASAGATGAKAGASKAKETVDGFQFRNDE